MLVILGVFLFGAAAAVVIFSWLETLTDKINEKKRRNNNPWNWEDK